MSYKLTNISGGQIVCDLAIEGKTLRLDNKQSKTIKDTEITSYIRKLVTAGLLFSEEISVEKKSTKKNTVKKTVKEKEE